MNHRIYKLTHRVSLMGFRPQDMIVLYVSYMLGFQIIGSAFPGRGRILFAIVFIVITFQAWQLIRDKLPDRFFAHLFLWLSEPEIHHAGADTHAIPLVVDPERIKQRADFAVMMTSTKPSRALPSANEPILTLVSTPGKST